VPNFSFARRLFAPNLCGVIFTECIARSGLHCDQLIPQDFFLVLHL